VNKELEREKQPNITTVHTNNEKTVQ